MRWGPETRPISLLSANTHLWKHYISWHYIVTARGLTESNNSFHSWNYLLSEFQFFELLDIVFKRMMVVLIWFCMTNIFLGILETFMKSFVYWQSHLETSSEKIIVHSCLHGWCFRVLQVLGWECLCLCCLASWVMSSSGCLKAPYIHCLELPDIEHSTMQCQCWALNVVANCKTVPQDIRWDGLASGDHFLWWHVTLTFSHEITTCAEKPTSGKFSLTMIINQVLTWTLSHKF